MFKRMLVQVLVVLMLVALFTSCTKKTEPETVQTLKVGMMSAVDAAPFYQALQAGYFSQEGVEVELILFTNGQNRQTALQTGQVDGAMTDLVALITQTAGDFSLVGTLSTDGVFPLLSRETLDGKSTVTAGTMETSVTNYLLEEYLLTDHTLQKVFINEIPARLEAVIAGQLDTGIFPEPFASIGEMRGLHKTVYDGIPSESLNIIAFTKDAIEQKEDAIRKFHLAYARAVKDLQADPGKARDILLATIPNLPPAIRDTMNLPQYHTPQLPSDNFVRTIIAWTQTVTGGSYDIDRTKMLDRRFVGK
jgi:NitT/TauT family transport system substrate-binding protein